MMFFFFFHDESQAVLKEQMNISLWWFKDTFSSSEQKEIITQIKVLYRNVFTDFK